MFTKEEIALAKPTVEAIKMIAGKRKCGKCAGKGWVTAFYPHGTPVTPSPDCDACDGTGKGKWEWEPKPRDEFIATDGSKRFIVKAISNGITTAIQDECGYHWGVSKVIPLLYWERIKETLEGMGYTIDIGKPNGCILNDYVTHIDDYECVIRNGNFKTLAKVFGKSCQLAVMRAVIELGKGIQP